LHDAALSQDGQSIIILAESGASWQTGNLFSSNTTYRANELSLWRLDRERGRLTREQRLPLPEGS
jgi:hypothetical protein